MTRTEYILKRADISRTNGLERAELAREYAESNNTVKINDTITDDFGSIKVDDFGLSASKGKMPQMIYYGADSNGNRRGIFQRNLKN